MLLQMALFNFLFMAELYSTVYVYSIFLIHSSVNGPLGCLHVLTVVNSAAGNTGVYVSFQIEFSLDIHPRVGLQSHLTTLYLVF